VVCFSFFRFLLTFWPEKRNLVIANRSRVSCAHKVTTVDEIYCSPVAAAAAANIKFTEIVFHGRDIYGTPVLASAPRPLRPLA